MKDRTPKPGTPSPGKNPEPPEPPGIASQQGRSPRGEDTPGGESSGIPSGAPELSEEDLLAVFYQETLMPELREVLGPETFRAFVQTFGGRAFTVPTLGELTALPGAWEILWAVRRYHAGAMTEEALATLAARHGVRPRSRIFEVARKAEAALAAAQAREAGEGKPPRQGPGASGKGHAESEPATGPEGRTLDTPKGDPTP